MISDCYDPAMSERVGGKPPSGVAFLLTQVGTHAARRFAERVAELSTFSLLWVGASVLLPIARFPALIWLVVAGALLPTNRHQVRQEG